MADTKTDTNRRAAAAGADGAAAGVGGNEGGENLEKVRDILFGSQMRDQEKRFARLEERIAKDLGDVRDETRKRLDALEGFIKKEIQSLMERMKAEQGQRVEAVKSLGHDLKETAKSFETRAAEIEDQTAQVRRGLREELLEQSKTLRDEIYKTQQDAGAAVDRAVRDLGAAKVDRTALAGLFNEIALRVGGGDDDADGQ